MPCSRGDIQTRRGCGIGESLGGGGVDGWEAHAELGRDRGDGCGARAGCQAERFAPCGALLARRRTMHVEVDRRAKSDRARFARGDDDQPANAFNEPGGTGGAAAGVVVASGRIGTVAFHEQDGSAERGLALPQAEQGVQFGGGSGDQVGGDRQRPKSDRCCCGGGNGAAVAGAAAAQLDDRHSTASAERRPDGGDAPGQFRVRRGQVRGRDGRDRFDQTGQPVVELRHTGKVVENPFVDAQRGDSERRPGSDFDEPPPPQGRIRRERAPMGVGQRGQGEAEGGKVPAGLALGCGAQRGEGRIQFYSRAKQEHASLKRGHAERGAQRLQRGGRTVAGRLVICEKPAAL